MSEKPQTHENFRRSHSVKTSTDRTFGIVFAIVLLIIALWPLRAAPTSFSAINWWALAITVILLAVALLRPVILRPANRLWSMFGLLLHRIVNPVVMAFLFFGVVTPYGVIMRLAGKDPMRRSFDEGAQTYWTERQATSATMKNQF